MKAGKNKKISYYLVLLLAISVITFGGTISYSLFFTPKIPQCRAVVQITNHLQGKTLQRILLVNIEPTGSDKMTVLLSGSFFVGDERYAIDRIIKLNYQRQGSDYVMTVAENNIRPQDTVRKEELAKRLPLEGLLHYLRIEKIDQLHYLFVGNHSPLFVCVVPPE